MILIFFIYRSTTLVVMFSVIDWIESIRLSLCFWSPHYQTKVVSYLFFFFFNDASSRTSDENHKNTQKAGSGPDRLKGTRFISVSL